MLEYSNNKYKEPNQASISILTVKYNVKLENQYKLYLKRPIFQFQSIITHIISLNGSIRSRKDPLQQRSTISGILTSL